MTDPGEHAERSSSRVEGGAELERALQSASDRFDELDPLSDDDAEVWEAARAGVLRAEMALARHRGEEHAEVLDLGVRWTAGAVMPFVVSGEHHAVVVCRTADAADGDDRFAVVRFDLVRELRLGGPSEDVLPHHPLHGRGLTWFAAHEVHDSRRIRDQVDLHVREDAGAAAEWEGVRHFFLTFHDRSVEVLARGISARPFIGGAALARHEALRTVSSHEDEPIWLT